MPGGGQVLKPSHKGHVEDDKMEPEAKQPQIEESEKSQPGGPHEGEER